MEYEEIELDSLLVEYEQCDSMDVESFRKSRDWTFRQLADALDLKSTGYLADLLRGRQSWPLELAMKFELLSEGAVRAADLVTPEKRELLSRFKAAQPGATA